MILLRLAGVMMAIGIALLPGAVRIQDVDAPSPAEVVTETQIDFPQGMTFSATIDLPPPDAEVDAVQLLYRIGSDETLNLEIVDPSDYAVDQGVVQVDAFVDLLSAFVPVGVELTFFWEVLLGSGDVVQTSEESTRWMDNRFDWEERASEQLVLYSYGIDGDFADMMLEESQASIDELASRYDLDTVPTLTIWVYPSYADFGGTMQGNSREAVAGVTYPGLDTILAVVPDGDEDEFGRVVPHEISHHVLFEATDNPYGPPPLWFDEGIATHTQIGGTAGYSAIVENALEDNRLFEITSLEASFPFQPQQATLAYASSWSMISYIETVWGTEGISRLISAFHQGMSSDDAIETALGVSIDELDDGWKAWIVVSGSRITPAA